MRRFGVGSTDDLPSMNPEQAEEIKAEVEEELQLKLEDLAVKSDGGEEAAEETAGDLAEAEAAAGVELSAAGGESADRVETGAQAETAAEAPALEALDLTEDELALLEQEAAYAAELEAAAAAREEEEERERR